eukprot:UN1858
MLAAAFPRMGGPLAPFPMPMSMPALNHVPDYSAGPTMVDYHAFRQLYPHDKTAYDYLMNSFPDVQIRALQSFRA